MKATFRYKFGTPVQNRNTFKVLICAFLLLFVVIFLIHLNLKSTFIFYKIGKVASAKGVWGVEPHREFESLRFRQDYFELIPSRSNNLQLVRGLLGCAPRALSGSDRLPHKPQCL